MRTSIRTTSGPQAHPVVYLLTEIGNLLAVCGPAFCVGVLAVLIAVRTATPARVLTVVAGVCGIVAPLYFPFAVYLLGVLAAGTWCLVSRARRPQAAPVQAQAA